MTLGVAEPASLAAVPGVVIVPTAAIAAAVVVMAPGPTAAAIPAAAVVVLVTGAQPSWTLAGASLVSGLMHGTYALALQAAYTHADLNVAYPVARGLGPVLVVFWAVLVLAEPMTGLGWLGLALTVVGVVVVSAGGTHFHHSTWPSSHSW